MDKKCDHGTLSLQEKTWMVRCVLCKKEWGFIEIRKALLSLEADKITSRRIYEIGRAIEWIRRDMDYILRQLGESTILVTGVRE